MRIAVDIDGTIDAAPAECRTIMSSLKAAGNRVVVLSGTPFPTASQASWDEKRDYLVSLGCGACWDELVLVPHEPGELADSKAKYCKDNGIDILIDNDKSNARAATGAGVPLVLVPWASRI